MLMDEPFSAVDPVVREQLQDEFLRLQGELGKTILFVTHDIDEAIKLGDQVAVLRVGGTLAQLAAPAYLLAHPVDDFVADFVGRDRGYRALSFQPTPAPADRRAAVRTRCHARGGHAGGLDQAGCSSSTTRTGRWAGSSRHRIDGDAAHRDAAPRRHGRHGASGPLRAALDAALSSPSRRGVIVDDDGALAGTVRAHEVLTAIEESQRPEAEDPVHAGGAGAMTWFLDHTERRAAAWPSQHIYLAGLPLVLGPAHRPAAGLAGAPLPAALPAASSAGPACSTRSPSLALFILMPAILGTPDPRPGQRRRRDDDLHRRAAGPHRRRRPGRGARRRRPGRDRDGLRPRQARFFAVELPLAVPVIAAGLRVAAVSNVSIVSVAAIIGVPQLGIAVHRRVQPLLPRPDRRRRASAASCWPCSSMWSSSSSPGCSRPGSASTKARG